MHQSQAEGSAGDAHNPYATPQASVVLPPPIPARYEYVPASRWARLGARVVDQLIVIAALVPMIVALAAGRNSAVFIALLVLTPVLLIALLVVNVISLDRRGQTLGKRLVGIRILRSDGSHPTLGRSFGLRAIVPFGISMVFGLFGAIDAVWIFGAERRCLHDLIADTIVVPAQ